MSSMRPFFTMGRYFLIALIGIIALPSDCRGTIHWIKSQSHYIISSTLSSKKHVLGFMLPLYKHISSYIYAYILWFVGSQLSCLATLMEVFSRSFLHKKYQETPWSEAKPSVQWLLSSHQKPVQLSCVAFGRNPLFWIFVHIRNRKWLWVIFLGGFGNPGILEL